MVQFKQLPAEIRCRIYYFAVAEPHPLPLFVRDPDTWDKVYVVEKDLRMINTNREFREEMNKLLFSENSFSFSVQRPEPQEGARQFRVELERMQKCYIHEEGSDYVDLITDSRELGYAMATLFIEGP